MINLESPETVGLSSERLKRVTSWLEHQVASKRLAGASVLVGRRGASAYFSAAGFADVEQNKPFAEDTIVRIYSMTKPVTSVAAMMLYEQGCFNLDDPLSKFIPSFANTKVQSKDESGLVDQAQPITIKHLLTHTAGLTYGFMHATNIDAMYRKQGVEFPSDAENLAEWVDRLASIPLICQPGTQWNYSVATDVLGRLIEIWSGKPLAEYLDEQIFQPLEMHDTGFTVAATNKPRFASLYAPANGATLANVGKAPEGGVNRETGILLQEAAETSPYHQTSTMHSGGGGLTGSIEDYGKFCEMLMNGGVLGDARLLSPKTVEYMRRNHLPDGKDMSAMGQPVWSETSYDGVGFGLGFAVVLDPIKAQIIASEGEHHWGGAASTFFWLDPEEDLYCVFFTQLMPSSTYPIRRELRTQIYQAVID